jgi:DNA-binding transcriptional ArsR family regulator
MNNKLAEKMAAVLKTIAHPDRLMIIKILTNGEKSVNKIVERLGDSQSLTSQHLNLMTDKGVLARRRDGLHVYYRIANRDVLKILRCLYRHCRQR